VGNRSGSRAGSFGHFLGKIRGTGADPELEASATFWGKYGERERIQSWKLRPLSGENMGNGLLAKSSIVGSG